MGRLSKADFYYGALLSNLINGGFLPAIFEKGEERRIYNLSNDVGDYMIYAKYVSNPVKNVRNNMNNWKFVFSREEINKIRTYENNLYTYFFALICGRKELKESEVALLSLEEIKTCLDVENDRPSYRVTIKYEKGRHGLGAYGTGIADKSEDGQDNTIRISRDLAATIESWKKPIRT